MLAKYVAEIVEKGLNNVKDNGGDLNSQVDLVNRIVSTIMTETKEADFDTLSVAERAEQLIKKKKAVRQIIVVTHNANIVIGADAEEVIIANQNGTDSPNKDSVHFSYRSGSIENDYPLLKENGSVEDGILAKQGIQQHICDILEGGEKAFEKRKNKYNLNS